MNLNISAEIAGLAHYALKEELTLYSKPGLVSYVDSGSHKDMDYRTFEDSIESLKKYWETMALAGVNGAEFEELRRNGLEAEKGMLSVTNGINTHRGAVFIMGILAAALGYVMKNNCSIIKIPEIIRNRWGADIKCHKLNAASHGSIARRSFTSKLSIIDMAAGGFEILFDKYLLILDELFDAHGKDAYLQLFFTILSETDDTNLLYRGGEEGLIWAQQEASNFLESGGIFQGNATEKATTIHQKFVSRMLSPGGCADILSATIFIFQAKRKLWG